MKDPVELFHQCPSSPGAYMHTARACGNVYRAIHRAQASLIYARVHSRNGRARDTWKSVRDSSSVRRSVVAVWGPPSKDATSYAAYVAQAANLNNQCVKEYLLDWIKCKASVTADAERVYKAALGVDLSSLITVKNLGDVMALVYKKVGQSVFNAAIRLLKQRSYQYQVTLAANWC